MKIIKVNIENYKKIYVQNYKKLILKITQIMKSIKSQTLLLIYCIVNYETFDKFYTLLLIYNVL